MPQSPPRGDYSPRPQTDRPFRLWIALIGMVCLALIAAQPPHENVSPSTPILEEQLDLAALKSDLPRLKSIWAAHEFSPPYDDPRSLLANPLRCAAASGSLPILLQLLDWGADPNFPSPAGRTPLMCAAGAPNSATIALVLLNHGANPTARDIKGRTPLSFARAAHDANLISLLKSPPHPS
jgi:Ankyrin repeats (many copies)